MMIRQFCTKDIEAMRSIWNCVVEEGIAFPQENTLTKKEAKDFFESQTYCGVAQDEAGKISGLYILHPNNVGRCSHIANASFAVGKTKRGQHIGKMLVEDCLFQAAKHGFLVMQFNAVVKTNTCARHLYETLGFEPLGVIPNGFRQKDGSFVDICPYYKVL